MFGKNPVRHADYMSTLLRVQSIFKTIQGEGPLSGHPAIFIRLAGCNLRCLFCDTDFESHYEDQQLTATEVITRVSEAVGDSHVRYAVITGGEPMLQPITGLILQLLVLGLHVQIETAGTTWVPGLEHYMTRYPKDITLVCSPKTRNINQNVVQYCHHWKYIITHGQVSPEDGLPIGSTQSETKDAHIFRPPSGRGGELHHIYVQPCDETEHFPGAEGFDQSVLNEQEAIRVSLKYGYQLSLQLHKILGLE